MKVLVFSDSHGYTGNIIAALKRHSDIEYVIHLGDYGTDVNAVLEHNPALMVEAVQGNNDRVAKYPLEKVIRVAERNIFITHGHSYGIRNRIKSIIAKALEVNAEAALFGHTHVPLVEWRDNILLINPGSIYRQRIARSPTYAVLNISKEILNADIYDVQDMGRRRHSVRY